MSGYNSITVGIDRYFHIAGSYIPILAFALKLRKGIKHETTAETYDVYRISQTKIPPDAYDTHGRRMYILYVERVFFYHLVAVFAKLQRICEIAIGYAENIVVLCREDRRFITFRIVIYRSITHNLAVN